MTCPQCKHENIAGSLFCDVCGADLEAAPAGGDPEIGSVLTCATCGHQNDADFVVCEACGQPLDDAEPASPIPAPTPAPPAADDQPPEMPPRPLLDENQPPPPVPSPSTPAGQVPGQLASGPRRGKVKLVVEQGLILGKQFLLSDDRMLVGREDAEGQIFPQIDLTGLDEGYVHRQHAELTFEGTFLFVTHLGGHNRTYVNNRPIADQLPHPLNIGDTVRFGKVVLRVVEV